MKIKDIRVMQAAHHPQAEALADCLNRLSPFGKTRNPRQGFTFKAERGAVVIEWTGRGNHLTEYFDNKLNALIAGILIGWESHPSKALIPLKYHNKLDVKGLGTVYLVSAKEHPGLGVGSKVGIDGVVHFVSALECDGSDQVGVVARR